MLVLQPEEMQVAPPQDEVLHALLVHAKLSQERPVQECESQPMPIDGAAAPLIIISSSTFKVSVFTKFVNFFIFTLLSLIKQLGQ